MRVLIVEDESIVAMLLEAMVEDLGHTVVGPAPDLATGLRLAHECDFAILDVNLGHGETSLSLAELLQANGTPFAFSSGYAPVVGFNGVPQLSKPFDTDELGKIFKYHALIA